MTESDHGMEARILQQLISGLAPLDVEARARLLDTVARFFDMAPSRGAARASPTVGDPLDISDTDSAGLAAPSPKAFLVEKNPQTLVERVACLAFYLTHFRDTPHFKTFDISQLNTEAAQTKFSNTAQSVADATKAGLLATATRGQKQLSAYGEEYAKALPNHEDAHAVKKRMKPKKARKKRASAKPPTH